jgi:hypothetical protein
MTTTTTADPHASQEDIVIEKLEDFPHNVAAYACHGRLTKADNESVLIPDIEEKLDRHKAAGLRRGRARFRWHRARRLVGGYEVQLPPPLRLGTQRDSHRRGMG